MGEGVSGEWSVVSGWRLVSIQVGMGIDLGQQSSGDSDPDSDPDPEKNKTHALPRWNLL
jgi:hypothetical protein